MSSATMIKYDAPKLATIISELKALAEKKRNCMYCGTYDELISIEFFKIKVYIEHGILF